MSAICEPSVEKEHQATYKEKTVGNRKGLVIMPFLLKLSPLLTKEFLMLDCHWGEMNEWIHIWVFIES